MPQFSTIEYIVQVKKTHAYFTYTLNLVEGKLLQDFHEDLVDWKNISSSPLCPRATSTAS